MEIYLEMVVNMYTLIKFNFSLRATRYVISWCRDIQICTYSEIDLSESDIQLTKYYTVYIWKKSTNISPNLKIQILTNYVCYCVILFYE